MTFEKFTQKSKDAVIKAQSIAVMECNSVIEPVHILSGVMKQDNGLIPQLIQKWESTMNFSIMKLKRKYSHFQRLQAAAEAEI